MEKEFFIEEDDNLWDDPSKSPSQGKSPDQNEQDIIPV